MRSKQQDQCKASALNLLAAIKALYKDADFKAENDPAMHTSTQANALGHCGSLLFDLELEDDPSAWSHGHVRDEVDSIHHPLVLSASANKKSNKVDSLGWKDFQQRETTTKPIPIPRSQK